MDRIIIVGSGIAGVAAALRFADHGIKPFLVDVGIEYEEKKKIEENIYDYCEKNDAFDIMIGEKYEALYNLHKKNKYVPVKLTTPRMRFVIKNADELSPIRENNFSAIQSFACGGLANAWGAGLYQFNNLDLAGFPILEKDLSAYYRRLTEEIGISGENDDLTQFFGHQDNLQKPLKLSQKAKKILDNYLKRKTQLNKIGVYIGRPRLGILSEIKDDRKPCEYKNLEFWQPNLSYIYNPSFTLNKLVKENKVEYNKDILVKSWTRQDDKIVLNALRLSDHQEINLYCKKLVLAAGAINSAKIVLKSKMDFTTRLRLLDNPALQFPLIFPWLIGKKLETDAFGLTQLNYVFNSEKFNQIFQGSILEITSPARAEFFANFPLAARDNLSLIRYMLPAMMVMQLFLPADVNNSATIGLNNDGSIEIEGQENKFNKRLIKEILNQLVKLGAYSVDRLVVRVPNGHGIHYAGTLPMMAAPTKPFQCDINCQLFKEPNIFVVDGSVFPALPAKNYSFTVMANAMRIVDFIVKN